MARKDLTQGNLPKLVLQLSIPLVLSNIFMTLFELVDAIFIGKLGPEALAGVSIAGSILFFLSTFAAGLGIGTVALISRFTGSKNYDKANETAIQSFILGFFIAFILGVVGYLSSPALLELLGAKGSVLQLGTDYIEILFLGIFTMFIMFLGNAVLRGAGDTKTPMKIVLVAMILNIVLDWILIFGKFGFPAMGVKGGAMATVISRGIGGLIFIVLLIKGDHHIHLNYRKIIPNFALMGKIFKIGFPASIQLFIRSTSAIVLITIVTMFGTNTIAAYGIGGRIFSLFLLPGFGFGDASSSIVGQNIGAGHLDRARKAALLSTIYYFIVLVILSSITYTFSETIIRIFNDHTEVVKIGAEFLRVISISALFMSPGVVLARSFQGAGDTVPPMIITAVILYLFQIPLAYLLSIHFHMNQSGIWLSHPIATFLQGFLMIMIFIKGKWLYKKI